MIVATDEWRQHVKEIILDIEPGSDPVNPRGMPSWETRAKSIQISMETPIVLCKIRKLNYRFMFGEAYWILSGSNDLKGVQEHMQRIADYSDNGRTLAGAYGPHVVRQLQYVKRALLNDRSTRQAVLTIWQERPEPSKDIPCTLSMQFMIRQNELHCVTSMRSSDAYLGLPYDLFVFSCIAARVRDMLGIKGLKLGELTVFAGSSHIYKRDFGKAFNCTINQGSDPDGRLRLYPGEQKHDNPPRAFDVYARCGVIHELERVLEAIKHGDQE